MAVARYTTICAHTCVSIQLFIPIPRSGYPCPQRLRQIDPEHLVYESNKPGLGGSVSLLLTPLELIERLAALIPPPRRHRYYGVCWRPMRLCRPQGPKRCRQLPWPQASQTRPTKWPANQPIARPRAMSGRSCWLAFMKCCRWSAPNTAATCEGGGLSRERLAPEGSRPAKFGQPWAFRRWFLLGQYGLRA